MGQPNWTPATQTPATADRSISASQATPSADGNVVGVAGDTTLQRRLSYGTPRQGQRGDDDSEATEAAMEMGAGERMAFKSAHAPGSTDAGAVGTARGGAAAAEEPLSVDGVSFVVCWNPCCKVADGSMMLEAMLDACGHLIDRHGRDFHTELCS